MSQYRTRWALVLVAGITVMQDRLERMCIAEKRTRFLWFRFWWPCGVWRDTEAQAQQDILEDQRLHAPLPDTKEIKS